MFAGKIYRHRSQKFSWVIGEFFLCFAAVFFLVFLSHGHPNTHAHAHVHQEKIVKNQSSSKKEKQKKTIHTQLKRQGKFGSDI